MPRCPACAMSLLVCGRQRYPRRARPYYVVEPGPPRPTGWSWGAYSKIRGAKIRARFVFAVPSTATSQHRTEAKNWAKRHIPSSYLTPVRRTRPRWFFSAGSSAPLQQPTDSGRRTRLLPVSLPSVALGEASGRRCSWRFFLDHAEAPSGSIVMPRHKVHGNMRLRAQLARVSNPEKNHAEIL